MIMESWSIAYENSEKKCQLFSILDCYTREWLAYTFGTNCGTDEAIMTLEIAVLPDGVIPLPPHSGLAIRSVDGGSQYM
jgi:hypothetical protein